MGLVVETAKADGVTPARLRRLTSVATYAVTVWFLLTLNFLLPRVMPGDPITAMLSSAASAGATTTGTASQREAVARYYGLDRPLGEQYVEYLGRLSQGDLGVSIRGNGQVRELVAERLPWTLLLGFTAVTVATAVGVVAGVQSGWRRNGRVDRGLITLFTAVRAVPAFLLGPLVLFVFSVKLGWFPLSGAMTPFQPSSGLHARIIDIAHHLVLPAMTMAVVFAAGPYLIMRAGMVSELGADYLLIGRAKGLGERRLKYRYAARNALLPLVAMTGLELSVVAAGGVIFVERVFAYPGIGELLFDAIAQRDYPLMQGCFLVMTLMVVTLNYLADAVSRRLDPRTAA